MALTERLSTERPVAFTYGTERLAEACDPRQLALGPTTGPLGPTHSHLRFRARLTRVDR